MLGDGEWHVGRSWSEHPLEDDCRCPKAACGLVIFGRIDPSCERHAAVQTIRQSHPASECPALSHQDCSRTVDLAAVSNAMLELEDQRDDPRPDVSVGEVCAKLLSTEWNEEFGDALLREAARARVIANTHYAGTVGQGPDHPGVLTMTAFMQGITFATAIEQVKKRGSQR